MKSGHRRDAGWVVLGTPVAERVSARTDPVSGSYHTTPMYTPS